MLLQRLLSIILSVAALLAVAACASDEAKVPTPEAITAQQAFEHALKIREAFLDDDRSDLQELCNEATYQKLLQTTGVSRDLSLEFIMRWVDIDEVGTIHLYVSWKRKGELSGKDATATGMVDFVMKGSPLLLTEILRESPFE